jgi:GMP synthase-like glutamine amidotransferase
VRVLSVTHGPTVGGGVFDETVERDGHELARWMVPLGSDPPDVRDLDAIIVFGGGMHPDQDGSHPWLAHEVSFLRRALDARVPMLGVCLGSQLIARALGAPVGPAPQPEVGWLEVELTDAGRADPVLSRLPARVEAFQWHSYTFGLPDGATELAVSPVARQAFALDGRAWGIQFHAEVTTSMIHAWAAEDPQELPMPVDELLAATDARIDRWNELGRDLCRAFLAVAARASGSDPRADQGST